jgi:phospholipid/cholesterol/gamma-HCH transport system ATP-binding protein
MSSDNLVAQAINLKAAYDERLILNGVDLDIPSEKITTIIGGSGSGKTTLLKHFIGLQRQVGGEVTVFGKSWLEMNEKQRESTQRQIGVLFQNGALLGSKTIETNIAIPLEQHTKLPASVISRVVKLKLKQVGLQSAGDHMPSELSGGMRKRAALARALALDPPLLFCDEPSAGLDPVTSFQLDKLLLDLRDSLGLTIVVVTHEIASIKRIADQIAYLEDGEMIFKGSLSEAVTDSPESVSNFFSTGGLTAESLKHTE